MTHYLKHIAMEKRKMLRIDGIIEPANKSLHRSAPRSIVVNNTSLLIKPSMRKNPAPAGARQQGESAGDFILPVEEVEVGFLVGDV